MRRIFVTLRSIAKLFTWNLKKPVARPIPSFKAFVDYYIEDTDANEVVAGYIKDSEELIPDNIREETDDHIIVALMGLAGRFGVYELNPPVSIAFIEIERAVLWTMINRPESATVLSKHETWKLLVKLLRDCFQVDILTQELAVS